MAYDNQSQPAGVIWAPVVGSTTDWVLDPVSGTKYSTSISSLNLDPKITPEEQIVVIRQFDFSTIASTPSPLLTGAEAWSAWTLPDGSAPGSSMYTISDGKVIMSDVAADYVYSRTVDGTVTSIQLPTFDKDVHQVYVLRKTQDLTNYINWTAGSRITAAQLNHGLLQLLNISQELSALQDNKHTLDPFVGKPGGICPLEADGTISNSYIGSATLSNSVGDGIEGDGTSAAPIQVDLAGVDGADSGLAFDESGDLKADTIDNLTSSTETAKPLSAKQGYTLDQKIAALGTGFTYKGTIDLHPAEEATAEPTDPSAGDTYDIIRSSGSFSGVMDNFDGLNLEAGDIIRYDGAAWVEIEQVQVIRADGTIALNTAQVAVTQSAADSTTKVSTTAFVQQEISGTKLSELSDVEADTDDTGGNMIVWDTDSWEPLRLETVDYTKQVLTTGSSINALDDVNTTGLGTGKILQFNGDGDLVPVDNPADITNLSVTVGSAVFDGSADESVDVLAAWTHATLGYYDGVNPDGNTVRDLDFKDGIYLCSATTNAAPAAARLTASSKRGITYKNGTLQCNEVNVLGRTLIDTGTITENTAHLANEAGMDAGYGEHRIKLLSTEANSLIYPGVLIRTGTDKDLQNEAPVWGWEDGTTKCYGGEMNIVDSYDRATGMATLRYPITGLIEHNEEITVPVWTATAATATITCPADGVTVSTDAIGKTIILEEPDGDLVTFTCVSSGGSGVTFDYSATLATFLVNLNAAIHAHASFTTVHATGTDPDTIVISQVGVGQTGNTTITGTLLAVSTAIASNTNFTGGTSPQVKDQVFENMTFEDLNTGTWHLANDQINTESGTGNFVMVLPRDHGMADTITFDAEIRSSITAGLKTGSSDLYTDVNGSRVITIDTDDETNEVNAAMSNSRTWSSSASTGGKNVMVSYGENVGISLKYAHNITFRNCHFKGWLNAVKLLYCDSITFENCTFTGGCMKEAHAYITMEGCRNIKIKGCEFTGGMSGILFAENEADYHANYDISIIDNTMTNIVRGIVQPNYGWGTSLLRQPSIIDSDICNNKISIQNYNPRTNWIYAGGYYNNGNERSLFNSTGISISGFQLRITDNIIGGGSKLVDETPDGTYWTGLVENLSVAGYGSNAEGFQVNPDGGLELYNTNSKNLIIPTCKDGISLCVEGGGRRGRYDADMQYPAAIGPLDMSYGNMNETIDFTPKGSPAQCCSFDISRNQIISWRTGVHIDFKTGSIGTKLNSNQPKIDHNNIQCMRRPIQVRCGYQQQRTIDCMSIGWNKLSMYHQSDIFKKVPNTKWMDAEGKNTWLVYGMGDACIQINQVAEDDQGVHTDNRFSHLYIKWNDINASTYTYRTYGIRLTGIHNQYWMDSHRWIGNAVRGGYYSMVCNPSTDHSTRSNWNSFYDNSLSHNYYSTWLAGAWGGSASTYAYYRNYSHTTYTGGTADGTQ